MSETIGDRMTGDHRRCDQLLTVVEGAAQRADWPSVVGQAQAFAEAMEHHFRFEEDELFPELESASPMAAGPTGVMRMEHEQVRQLLADLQAAAQAEDSDDCIGIIETLHMLIQQHNAKEEGILYPLADQALEHQAAALLARFSD